MLPSMQCLKMVDGENNTPNVLVGKKIRKQLVSDSPDWPEMTKWE